MSTKPDAIALVGYAKTYRSMLFKRGTGEVWAEDVDRRSCPDWMTPEQYATANLILSGKFEITLWPDGSASLAVTQ